MIKNTIKQRWLVGLTTTSTAALFAAMQLTPAPIAKAQSNNTGQGPTPTPTKDPNNGVIPAPTAVRNPFPEDPGQGPEPTPRVEATASPTPCSGQQTERQWVAHADFLSWSCAAGALSFESTTGNYLEVKKDGCGNILSSIPKNSYLAWDETQTTEDGTIQHRLVELDSDGHRVGNSGWLSVDLCCSDNNE